MGKKGINLMIIISIIVLIANFFMPQKSIALINQFNTSAIAVIGQADFSSCSNANDQGDGARGLQQPDDIFVVNNKMFVTDTGNNRVLIYNSVPTSNNAIPDVVIGQRNLCNSALNQGQYRSGANTLAVPYNVYSDGVKLFIADAFNHRVLIYNSIPTQNNASADVVIGQSDFLNNAVNQGGGVAANTLWAPRAVWIQGAKLFIVDEFNHRVLIFNSIPTSNNASADVVIGQPDKTSNTANNGGRNANTLYDPLDVSSDGTNLFIADSYNHRVLIFNSIPIADNANADVVIGQPNMTSGTANNGGRNANTLYTPIGVHVDGTKLYIADTYNHRALIFNSIPVADNANADIVVGQQNMTSGLPNQGGGTTPAANTLYRPFRIYVADAKLFLTDHGGANKYDGNNRVLIYNSIPAANNVSADVVVGQSDFISFYANRGRPAANTLDSPVSVSHQDNKMFITDNANNRVLIYNSMPTSNNVSADVVVGQPDMNSFYFNQSGGGSLPNSNTLFFPADARTDGGKFFVSDYYNNRVLIYNSIPAANDASADVVVGQSNMTVNLDNQGGAAAANTLHNPQKIAIGNDKLIVADYLNNRVLIYNSIPTANNASADVVVGQQNMTSVSANQGGAVAANTLFQPRGVFISGSKLIIADTANNRVLIYNSIPTSNNALADVVVGQPDFISNSSNQGGSVLANTLSNPQFSYFDGTRLYIADSGNDRVLVYNSIPISNNTLADAVIGQTDFSGGLLNQGGYAGNNTLSTVSGIDVDPGANKLYLADSENNRVLVYDLSLKTTSAALPETGASGANNLLWIAVIMAIFSLLASLCKVISR